MPLRRTAASGGNTPHASHHRAKHRRQGAGADAMADADAGAGANADGHADHAGREARLAQVGAFFAGVYLRRRARVRSIGRPCLPRSFFD